MQKDLRLERKNLFQEYVCERGKWRLGRLQGSSRCCGMYSSTNARCYKCEYTYYKYLYVLIRTVYRRIVSVWEKRRLLVQLPQTRPGFGDFRGRANMAQAEWTNVAQTNLNRSERRLINEGLWCDWSTCLASSAELPSNFFSIPSPSTLDDHDDLIKWIKSIRNRFSFQRQHVWHTNTFQVLQSQKLSEELETSGNKKVNSDLLRSSKIWTWTEWLAARLMKNHRTYKRCTNYANDIEHILGMDQNISKPLKQNISRRLMPWCSENSWMFVQVLIPLMRTMVF